MSEIQTDYKWEQPATEEEQQAYEEVVAKISDTIYNNDQAFAGIEKMLQGPDPVDSLARATVLLITEIDKKIDIPEYVLPQLPFIVFDMLNEIGTKAGFFELDDQQIKTGLGAAQETLLRAYGFSEEDVIAATEGVNEQDGQALVDAYQEVTNGQGFAQKGS